MVRDATMAANVRWVLEREGPEGRILVFAHNIHVMKGATLKVPQPEYFPGKPPTRMGQYLRAMFGNKMVVLGFTFQGGEEMQLGSADPASVDGVLAHVGLPRFALDLRSAPKTGPVADWLNQRERLRHDERYIELVPSDAFDVLIFTREVTAVHPIH